MLEIIRLTLSEYILYIFDFCDVCIINVFPVLHDCLAPYNMNENRVEFQICKQFCRLQTAIFIYQLLVVVDTWNSI